MDTVDVDCLIIGAGFGGLRALVEMRRRGFSAQVLEAGTDVGGTWYWNRYPGARTDCESWVYCLSFDEGLLQEWDWRDRFPSQPQVQAYLAYVADRFDLRKDIEFRVRVERAERDEERNRWTVTTDDGRSMTCRYLVTAAGLLSAVYKPPFPGLETFRGEFYMAARWPKEKVEFAGKRVGVVGTGATGVQLVPVVAHAAQHVTVFQRTPNYVLPARNWPLEDVQRDAIKANYGAIWEKAKQHGFGLPFSNPTQTLGEASPEEVQRVLEHAWEIGGFQFLFGTFTDLITDERANEVAAEFVRKKIRTIVHDSETAELLCPKNYPLGGKRPPLGHDYYEAFNRENVNLVDVSANPIEAVTEQGLRLTDGSEHEFDILVFATGFDAATGALTAMDLRGSDGQSLSEVWAPGAQTQLGIAVHGFPNMFMIGGPGSPFGNYPPVAEFVINWIADALDHLRRTGNEAMEADQEAMDAWSTRLQDILDQTVLGAGEAVHAWFVGANIPGKVHTPLFYLGGVPAFLADLQESVDHDYAGFTFSSSKRTPALA